MGHQNYSRFKWATLYTCKYAFEQKVCFSAVDKMTLGSWFERETRGEATKGGGARVGECKFRLQACSALELGRQRESSRGPHSANAARRSYEGSKN